MNLPAAVLSFVLAASASPVESKSSIRGQADASPRDLEACPFPSQCCGFFALEYNPFDFDNYDNWYKDDSAFTLAQTGTYYGADGIKEYARFASPFSDYFAEFALVGVVPGFKEFDEDGLCVLTFLRTVDYKMNPDLTKGASFRVATLATIYYDPTPGDGYPFGYIKKENLYYADGSFKFFFGALDTPEARSFVCNDVLVDVCGYASDPDCESDLAKLPQTERGYIDGDSQGCRFMHAIFAKTNTFHCPHVTLDPDDTDSSGGKKCSESSRVRPLDLFDGRDIGLFRQYCAAQGINPAKGEIVL